MKYKLTFVVGLILILLNGCATNYRNVDASKIISSVPPVHEQQESANVTIRRDLNSMGSALDGRFIYDGVHIVTLSSGEYLTFKAQPGAHILGVKSYQPLFFVPVPFEREIKVNFEAGKDYEYILVNIMSAGLNIIETSELNQQGEAAYIEPLSSAVNSDNR